MRTREVGIQEIHHKIKPYEVELIRRDYTANGGWETFLSYEDPEQGNCNSLFYRIKSIFFATRYSNWIIAPSEMFRRHFSSRTQRKMFDSA